MTEMGFFDTNLLVYVHDRRDPRKQEIASGLIESHYATRRGALSTQVLQEFFVVTTRKTRLLPVAQAATVLADYSMLDNLVVIEPRHILDAIGLQLRVGLSFWDALILTAAKSARATVVYSEDLTSGRSYEDLRVENPFRVRRPRGM